MDTQTTHAPVPAAVIVMCRARSTVSNAAKAHGNAPHATTSTATGAPTMFAAWAKPACSARPGRL